MGATVLLEEPSGFALCVRDMKVDYAGYVDVTVKDLCTEVLPNINYF
jgi:hypothetical protein